MKNYFFPSLKITALTVVLFGVLFPLFITGLAKIIAPNGGKGETILLNGKTVGFELIGQSFTNEKYFASRPSTVNYNAAATGGSNKGPSNPDYLKQVEERIGDFLSKNPGIKIEDIPVDLVTASGGGLDPHISPSAALIQVQRIAKVRGMSEEVLRQLIKENTEGPLFGLFGTPTVHVLRLNILLDTTK
jgi:potassium-transporting ATPase KdpC subunit